MVDASSHSICYFKIAITKDNIMSISKIETDARLNLLNKFNHIRSDKFVVGYCHKAVEYKHIYGGIAELVDIIDDPCGVAYIEEF